MATNNQDFQLQFQGIGAKVDSNLSSILLALKKFSKKIAGGLRPLKV
jgi:hypothetical protein